MKDKYLQVACCVTALVSLSCCGGAATTPTQMPQMMIIDGATVVGTGKTISDHIVSFTTGKDCSTLRKNTGRHYCEEDEVMPQKEVFCYNTLGQVSCYTEPAPHGERESHLGKTSLELRRVK
ncbi:MAG: hypothetical protein VX617_06365 [Pseudomonadota bacterium]|nr:hypothetical protein [Pseudomonadota bacterium]